MSSIFKKIIDKEIPADIVYEDDEIMAFKDAYPVAPVHILVVPKKEIANLNYMKEEDIQLLGKIQYVISKLAKEFGVDEEGYRVISNIGENGGQTIYHMHYHLIGGRKLGTDI